MSGADSRGFDWKEIAGVLHIAGVSSRVTFWREVQRLGARNVDREPRTILHNAGSDSDSVKPDKLPAKRGEKLFSTAFLSLRRRGGKRRKKL
jgi:hypothetical protein